MKKSDIKPGITYHNGKTGNRSYSARKVISLNAERRDWYSGITHDGVKYEQIAGPYKGETNIISEQSFSQWAKGIFEGVHPQ